MSGFKPLIFVFGSNREGRHGKGAALVAMREWGAVYGVAAGLTGNAYAIVTKELRKDKPPVTLDEVAYGIREFLAFAMQNPAWQFILPPIGCGLAGFTVREIWPLFHPPLPKNVAPTQEFRERILAAGFPRKELN